MTRPWAAIVALVLGPVLPARLLADAPLDAPPARHWADELKQPVDWLTWGADVRLRNDSSDNASLTEADPPGHQVSFERLRLRMGVTASPVDYLSMAVRLAWEGRHYWAPDSADAWDRSEVVFDNLYLRGAFPGVTVVVGRQDLVFGEGWLVSDGTPLDGPRTSFLDAARVTVALPAVEGTLDVVYIDQRAESDVRLTPIVSRHKMLAEQDERGAIVYLGAKAIAAMSADAYAIYKHDEPVLPAGDRGDVYTVGGALGRELGAGLATRVEGAYQLGHRSNRVMLGGVDSPLSAWGGSGRLTYAAGLRAWVGFEVMSGNAAGSATNHQFDPLWGRWARYSELFPGELDRPGDRANVVRLNAGGQAEPIDGMLLQLNYHALFAYADRKAGTPGYSDAGRFEGHLVTALLRHSFNRFWTAKVLVEAFAPGGHYEAPVAGGPLASRDDPAGFARVELFGTF